MRAASAEAATSCRQLPLMIVRPRASVAIDTGGVGVVDGALVGWKKQAAGSFVNARFLLLLSM